MFAVTLAAGQTVTVTPTSLSFSNQVLSTPSSVQTVTLQNGLTTALKISKVATSSSDYSATNTCPLSPLTLAAGKTCTISVTFTPGALGIRSGSLKITDNASNSPQSVTLTGTGIAAVTASPASLAFGNQAIGLKSSASSVTITNSQTTALTIKSITTSLGDYTNTTTCPLTPSTLAAGGSCTISIFFTPAAAGSRKGTLTISDNASNNPTVSLTGTGVIAATTSPTSLSFTSQALGTTSAAKTVTLTNNQSASLTIASVTSSVPDFGVSSACPATLAGGANCTVSVTFSPKATGTRSGTLTFSDSANNSPQTVSLSGTGAAANLVSIAVSPAPASIALGSTQQFASTGTYSDGTTKTLTSSVKWTSSVGTVASINSSGLATSLAQGTTTITATSGTVLGSSVLTVTAPVLTSIAVTPATATILLGTSQQFTAIGTYSNKSTQNVTASVNWSSSAGAVASINSAGVALSIAQGNTTITAASGTVSGSSSLTVGPPLLVSIAVSPVTASIPVGTSQQFTATGTYGDGSTQNLTSSATWSSSSATIASVTSSGLASGIGKGSATITAAFGTISGSATLTVAQPALVSIAITPGNASFALGTTQPLKAIGTYTDGSTLDISTSVTWNTANSGIATVNAQGLVASVAVGGTSVTATLGSISGTTTLTVNPATLVSIAITPAIPAIPLGTTVQFSATGTFTDGSTQNVTDTVQWSSDATAVATISNSTGSQGLARSVETGTANITATSGSVQGTTTLTVTSAALVSIAVTPENPTIALGTTQQFVATGTFTDSSTQNLTSTATWSSDTPSSAPINGSGLASSVAVGTATISATSNNITGSTLLSVTPAQLVSIAVSPSATNIPLGTSQTFTALGTYTDGTTQDVTQAGHWSSSNAAAATISNTPGSQGLASTLGTGSTTIAIALGSVNGTATLTVNPAALVTITLSPQTPTIPLGTTQQFTASGTYTDGSIQDLTATVQWTSSSAMVAVMNATGLATSAGTGTATITATLGTATTATTLTVGPAAIVSLAVSPSPAAISLGMTQQFQAIATYTDGTTQDLTASANWSSDTQSVALVSSGGLASGIGMGAVNITASASGVSGSGALTVGPPALVSLTVTPSALSIPLGTTQQFVAIGTYTNGSTQNLTGSVTWNSSSNAASINATGVASATAVGAATITASSGSISATAALTIEPPTLVSLTVTPSTVSIPLGTTQQFAASGKYTDGSTQDLTGSVTWNSSGNAVSLSATGLASATATGTATITASDGPISASASMAVGPAALVSIAITPGNASFALGTTQPLKAIGTYTDGSTLDISTSVTWNTANSGIATVNAQGLVASVAVGGTSVTATLGSISGTTTLTVNPATLVSIAITPAIPAIPLGTTVQFSATGTFTDGSTQNVTDTVQWSSDATAVATISNSTGSQGLARSVETGTANITATSGSVQGTTTLTVTSAALVSIAVTPENPTIALGTTQQFVATGTFTDSSTQNLTSTATWSSDTPSSAPINGSGLASSVAVGTATISATSNNITGSTLLSVTPAQLVSIAVSPSATNIPLGTSQTFTALGTYTDGTTQDVTQAGHWSSSNAAAATISNTPGSQGLASTLGTGSTTIAIALGSVNGTATLTVNPAALVTITLSPQTPTIPLGTTQQFTASGTYTDGSIQDLTATVQWTSSSAMVAVMNATGLATSAGTGTATITATLGTATTATTLTVGPAAIVSLAVSPSPAAISLGMTQQFQAIATYTDGTTQDLTASANWSSSLPGVAAVSATGLATSLSSGTTTISASSGGASAGAVLTIAPAVPGSLAVTPTTASIAFGAQQQFEAFLTYSDGSIVNVTNLVTWSSYANTVATISSTGLATSVGAGSTIIYASASNGMIVGSALSVSPPSLTSIAVTPANPTLALSSSQQFTATGTFADNSTQNLTASVSWASSNSSVVSVSGSGLGSALQFGSSTITATSGKVSGSDAVTVPTASAIPASLFDMTVNKTTTPWPTDTFYGQRLLGTGTLWGDVETANGTYSWTTLNKLVSNAQKHGVDLIYTFLGVPQWASSNPSDASCSSWPGSCDPPNDLNSDGTGSNAQWDSFVTKIATQMSPQIKYWELWDEPNVAGYANPKTWTTAQWIRMASDARRVILGINPSAVILSPGTAVGTTWLTNFLGAGGGNYVDVIAFHGYANPPESVVSLITPVRAAMAAGGVSSLPLWDTEASWGLDTVLPDPNMQAGSVARLYLLNASNGVARLYWYGWDFTNRGTLWQTTSSSNCETQNNGGYICLAGTAYGQVYNWLNGAVLSGCSSSGTIWTCNLARPGGYLAQVMWDSSRTCSIGVCQTTPYTPPAQFIQYRDLNGNTFPVNGSVPLGAEPILLEN